MSDKYCFFKPNKGTSKTNSNRTIIKSISPILKLIVVVMLLLCLAEMPYGYFELARYVASAAFVYISYGYFKYHREELGFTFAALAILFQPFFKIALGRVVWNIVDVIVAAGLIYQLIRSFRRK